MTPRIFSEEWKYIEKEDSKSIRDTPESEQDAFVVRPDEDIELQNNKSSSIISTSKSSVGFIKDFYRLVELIKYRTLDKLREELMKADSDVYGPIDMAKKTLLHYAWEFNSIDVWEIIVDVMFTSKLRKPIVSLKEWVNNTTNNGLTAIHFAAYRGNNRLIKYLISLGANVHWVDHDGHNWIHIASQADKINTIYFLLKNYGFDINQGDHKLSTALHWAAFLNKENALTYLLAWGADPNLQDIDNNTPLHLSVILSCKTGNTRNVKLLLLKGASRNIKNNDNYQPINLISSENSNTKELKGLLNNPTFLSWWMLRPPLTKLTKNERTVVFFIILLIVLMFLTFSYVIPTFESKIIPIVSGVLGLPILISFAVVTLKDPGYLQKHPKINFQELLDTLDPLDIWPEWEIILTPRCRHCNIWNKWVERFDHHWPYINNWVGYNNHSYFLMYIFSLGTNLAYHFILCVIAIAEHDSKGESLIDDMKSVPMFWISSLIVLIITGMFVLPVLFLVFIHSTNFA